MLAAKKSYQNPKANFWASVTYKSKLFMKLCCGQVQAMAIFELNNSLDKQQQQQHQTSQRITTYKNSKNILN
jgi:hypothetical protein